MESEVVDGEDDLHDLPATVMENILKQLDHDDTWLTLATSLTDRRGRRAVSDELLGRMKGASSPGREVIEVLRTNLCRVSTLQAMLERCHLYTILKTINTNEPVKILAPEDDLSFPVTLGSLVTLPLEVCGSPFPDLQWLFNGKPIPNKTQPELSIESFSLSDAGEYSCRVRQRLRGVMTGVTSARYILSPSDSAPKITTDLQDSEIQAYQDLVLEFAVSGYPDPACFSWFKNNRFIAATDSPKLKKGSADFHSSGEYHCEVSSRAGTCATRRALVKVKEPKIGPGKPEVVEQPIMSRVCYEGEHLVLSCEVVCCLPVTFTCFLNNEMLPETSSTHSVTTTRPRSRLGHHQCQLRFFLAREQLERDNWRPLVFKFEASSAGGRTLTDDARVKVKTRDIKRLFVARNKWALLIGNTNYRQMRKLPAARNDTRTIQRHFVGLGFRVLMLTDLTRSHIQNAVLLFGSFIQAGDYVSFFYAGHGIHSDGIDYIVPLDATLKYISRPQNVSAEKLETVSLDECLSYVWITNVLQRGGPALLFSIYDTCRGMMPRLDGYQSNPSQDTFQIALKNSFFIFATSENYAAFETDRKDSSLLMDTLQALINRKIPVTELANQVLENFKIPDNSDLGEQEANQVPKISGDLALPLSLTDPSRPQEADKTDSGILMKWERLGGLGGEVQDWVTLPHTSIRVSVCWGGQEPRKDGTTWVISNSLVLVVGLSREWQEDGQELDVQINLSIGVMRCGKLMDKMSSQFLVPRLHDFEGCVGVELCFSQGGQLLHKKLLHLEAPAISQHFFKGNRI